MARGGVGDGGTGERRARTPTSRARTPEGRARTPDDRRARTSRGGGAGTSGRRPVAAEAPTGRQPLTRWQRVALAGLVVLVVVGGLSAMPLRGWLAQKGEIAGVREELAQVREDNESLQRRLTVLDDPSEIQRIARREYGLVDEGEESYTILPPATAGVVLPEAWPFDVIADSVAAASTTQGG